MPGREVTRQRYTRQACSVKSSRSAMIWSATSFHFLSITIACDRTAPNARNPVTWVQKPAKNQGRPGEVNLYTTFYRAGRLSWHRPCHAVRGGNRASSRQNAREDQGTAGSPHKCRHVSPDGGLRVYDNGRPPASLQGLCRKVLPEDAGRDRPEQAGARFCRALRLSLGPDSS